VCGVESHVLGGIGGREHGRGSDAAAACQFLHVTTDRDFPYRSIRLLASEPSTRKRPAFEDREYTV
jgi:aspartate-semialdehyde dehydrogenase